MATSAKTGISLNPHRRPASPDLKVAIAALVDFLEEREAALKLRNRARRPVDRRAFQLAITVIACNLAWLCQVAPGQSMAVRRDNNLMNGKSRYKATVFGQGFIQALDLMAHPSLGFIETVQVGYRFADNRQSSLIKPLPAFLNHMPASMMAWDSFTCIEPCEVLILKSAKDSQGGGTPEEYRDTERTRQMRREIVRLNKHLQAAPLLLRQPEGACLVDDLGHPIDPNRRALRRIFNNGSWNQGGRLFDGFWETMPRRMRFEHLQVCSRRYPSGEAIANVDFEQLFPRLAYHRANQGAPDSDLYDIEGNRSNRDGWKQLLNAMLFSQGPLRNWPDGLRDRFSGDLSFKVAIAAINERHHPISHLFGTGIGFKFMFTESSALIAAVLELFHRGITALPLHDSVLVALSEAETAREVLQRALEQATGLSRAAVSIDIGK